MAPVDLNATIAKQQDRIDELEGTVRNLKARLEKKENKCKPKAPTGCIWINNSQKDAVIKKQQKRICELEETVRELEETLKEKGQRRKPKVPQVLRRTGDDTNETRGIVHPDNVEVCIASGENREANEASQRRNKEDPRVENRGDGGWPSGSQQTIVKEETHESTWTKTKGKAALKSCPRDIVSKRLATIGEGVKPEASVTVIILIERFVKWLYEIKRRLKNKDIEHVVTAEVKKGSIIITFIVEETHKITEKWIQSLLDIVFEDVLGEFIDERETNDVTVVWTEMWPVAMTENAYSTATKKKGHKEPEKKSVLAAKEKRKELELVYG